MEWDSESEGRFTINRAFFVTVESDMGAIGHRDDTEPEI